MKIIFDSNKFRVRIIRPYYYVFRQGFVCVCLNFSLRAINLHDLYFLNNGLKMDVKI